MNSIDSFLFDILHLSGRHETTLSEAAIGLMRFITHFGDAIFLAVLSSITLAFLLYKKHYTTSIYWATSVVFSFIFCAGLKNLFGRQRPDDIYHLVEASSPALPSGHALKSTVIYIGIYILIRRLFALSSTQQKWMKLLFLLPFFIGMSRVFLGVHWPSDVIIGWLFGASILWVFYKSSDIVKLPAIDLKVADIGLTEST